MPFKRWNGITVEKIDASGEYVDIDSLQSNSG